ncbi:Extracellular ligand-binding receptor [Candidatus Sulfotelmatobacter kueseliae]|uniref:Extracellular ligand-binding receptor n=1 Tax=Candidatus Sulfotelmatobacter kueseliae TaxID=2042962 RepID=A0A2U3KJ03_9BACT|nr:Extracellular ligand-binding receptor [Candidatus Sulfotelmatobacter kueseliae]
MRLVNALVMTAVLTGAAWAQTPAPCSCGKNPPGPPAPRSLKPYAGAPDDLRPFSKYAKPYYEYYQNLIEYNGAARDIPDPDLKDLDEIRIGFLAPLRDHPDQVLGNRMLNGATMAIDEANAAGGYGGKPFRLITHNDYNNWQNQSAATGVAKDSAIWGAASNDAVRMIYDDKVWAMFGSISAESTHIALRLSLKAETPIVNSASTDPTIPETIIPWYFTNIQDDRVQGYTLARHIYTELGFRRVAILRINDRYGRFGVLKFRDASRRLGHPVVIEQKFMPGDTDFRRQLAVIEDSRVDAVVIWADIGPTAEILKEMRELGMRQRVFGSHRTISGTAGDELIKLAGPAAEGFEAVYPYDPTRADPRWLDFVARYQARFHEAPDHFAALAYDAMQILLDAICRAGLNRGRIRDALTGIENYKGVTGDLVFDPNCKNIAPMYLGRVHNGTISYRRITMEKAYARVGENGVQYAGPALPDEKSNDLKIGVFGPHAGEVVKSLMWGQPRVAAPMWGRAPSPVQSSEARQPGVHLSLIPIPSESSWGKASADLVKAVYQDHVLALIALDRNSSHLAEQIGVKSFVPVVAISSDRALTSTNIPWIFRLPEGTPVDEALRCLYAAIAQAGPNRASIREVLASGALVAGVRFESTGELMK